MAGEIFMINKRLNRLLIRCAAAILFASQTINAGAFWPSRIDHALRHKQRVTPPYFHKSPEFNESSTSLKGAASGDIRISESASPATFGQRFASAAALRNGRNIIVWQDDRMGSGKIYAQIFDSLGNPIGKNLLLIGRNDGYDLIEPKIVSDDSGNITLGYRDAATGRIYAARFDSDLKMIVAPFPINDVLDGGYAGIFDIDCFEDGRLIAVWENYSPQNDIFLRIFDAGGLPISDFILANSDTADVSRWNPSIATIKSGIGMGVVWEDYRSGNADIYMRVFNGSGVPGGEEFLLVDATHIESAQYLPEIVFSNSDGYLAAWLDNRNGNQEIYLQRVIPGMGLIGNNIHIAGYDELSENWDMAMTVSDNNTFSIAWASIGSANRILLRRFGTGLSPLGENETVNQYFMDERWETTLSGDGRRLICGWTDYRNGNSDIYCRTFDSELGFTGDERLANDDSRGAHSAQPDIAGIDISKNIVVFSDARFDDGDIFLQFVGVYGNLIGGNVKINTDTFPALQSDPAVATGGSKALVVWKDNRNLLGMGGIRIFGRFLTASGSFSGSDFAISDSGDVSAKSAPSVAFNRRQDALIAWVGRYNQTDHIFVRMITGSGQYKTDPFLISEEGIDFNCRDLSVLRDSADIFTIAWIANSDMNEPKAIIARLNSNGEEIDRFDFRGDIANVKMSDIAAAVNDSGNIYLLWQGIGEEKCLFLTVLSPRGSIVYPTFNVVDRPNADPGEPDLGVDSDGNIMAVWVDARSGRRAVYYQVYLNDMTPLGSNTIISSTPTEYMETPSVMAYRGRGWISWTDPRSEGKNIYLSQNLLATTAVDEHDNFVLPPNLILEQNYPNPFNPITSIGFALPSRMEVEVAVFDILGRKVVSLANQTFEAGRHTIRWDGCDKNGNQTAGGIYFYCIKAGDKTSSRKMILLK
jgi:hypothetical protein